MADALTTGLKTYGEIRTKIGVAVAVVVALVMCICGWMIVMKKETHTQQTTGTLTDVSCSSNVCTATALYSVGGSPAPSPAPYRLQANWPMSAKTGQSVPVYYNPANPSDASPGPVPKGFGWGLIACGAIVIILAYLFMKFFSRLSNQGKAVVGGLEAAQNLSSLFSKN